MGTMNDKLNYLVDTKSRIKTALINKSVEVPENTPFRSYATKIDSIVTLDEGTSDANATSSDILENKTGYVDGQKITGNIPTLETDPEYSVTVNEVSLDANGLQLTKTFNNQNGIFVENGNSISLSASANIVANAIGLTANKIKKGVTILGITGTYDGTPSDSYEETYNILNDVDGQQDTYTEPGGTDAEIEEILDSILGDEE